MKKIALIMVFVCVVAVCFAKTEVWQDGVNIAKNFFNKGNYIMSVEHNGKVCIWNKQQIINILIDRNSFHIFHNIGDKFEEKLYRIDDSIITQDSFGNIIIQDN